MTYLGVPLSLGRLKTRLFDNLVKRVRKKIGNCKLKLLSPGGRLILVKHVLSSMPIHLMIVMKVLVAIVSQINSLFTNFL